MNSRAKLVCSLALAALVGCSDEPVGSPGVALKILSVSPDSVYVEGGDTVQVTTENGCAQNALEVTVGEKLIPSVQRTAPDVYTFVVAPAPKEGLQRVPLTFTCSAPPEGLSYAPGQNVGVAELTYDPALEPSPTVAGYGPLGNRVSVLARMTVRFSRAMDPATITADTVFIEGVESDVTFDAATNEATVTPREQLPYGATLRAVVMGGASGVKSLSTGRSLRTTIASEGGSIDPARDTWEFSTRQEGDGNPWVGDIAAAAGHASGGGYKLFSVTAQPSPVGVAFDGTAENHQYKLQAGFLYATEPATVR